MALNKACNDYQDMNYCAFLLNLGHAISSRRGLSFLPWWGSGVDTAKGLMLAIRNVLPQILRTSSCRGEEPAARETAPRLARSSLAVIPVPEGVCQRGRSAGKPRMPAGYREEPRRPRTPGPPGAATFKRCRRDDLRRVG